MLQSFQHLSDVDFANLPDRVRDAIGTNESTIRADFLIDGFNLEWYETGEIDTTVVIVHDQKVVDHSDVSITGNVALQGVISTLKRAIRDSLAVEDDASQEECFRRAHEFI
jgi:hypothetical protein